LTIAGRGLAGAACTYGEMLRYLFDSFDEVKAGIQDVFPYLHARFVGWNPDPCYQTRNTQLAIAGWSQERQECEAYLI
jgi:hypothetical protein